MKILLITLFVATAFLSFGQVPSYVPANGLVGWWGFNGNANDESGNGYDGTVNGATLTNDRDGIPNSAYYFDGQSVILTNQNIPISGNESRSITFWCKQDNYSNNPVVSWGNDNIGERFNVGFNLQSFGLWTGTGSSGVSRNYLDTNVTDWNFYCFILDEVENATIFDVKMYQNAVLSDSVIFDIQGSTVINTAFGFPLNIGQIISTGESFNGSIDDIGIWNRALSECEITELYTGQDCNVGISELNSNQTKELIKIVNLLGQEVEYTPNTILIYQYSDGTSEKVFTIED